MSNFDGDPRSYAEASRFYGHFLDDKKLRHSDSRCEAFVTGFNAAAAHIAPDFWRLPEREQRFVREQIASMIEMLLNGERAP